VHVLRQIHKALGPGGVLLDIHPLPGDLRVEVTREGRTTPLGTLDASIDSDEIRQARKRLLALQREGLFTLQRRRIFEVRIYHDSVVAWLDHRREHGSTTVISPELLSAARRSTRAKGSRLVIRERVRASVFRRTSQRGQEAIGVPPEVFRGTEVGRASRQ